MEDTRNVTLQFTAGPADVYDPFLWSWQNIIRWVGTLCACVLIYDKAPTWYSAHFDGEIRTALLISLLVILALFILFLLPWLAVKRTFRNYPNSRKARTY